MLVEKYTSSVVRKVLNMRSSGAYWSYNVSDKTTEYLMI